MNSDFTKRRSRVFTTVLAPGCPTHGNHNSSCALSRMLDVLTDRPFRTEAAHIPGYDLSRSGSTEAA